MSSKKGKIRESLKVSLLEGLFGSAMLGFTESFWVACAEAVKVSIFKAGVISTFPYLISSITQTSAGFITKKFGGRLSAITKLIAIQSFSLLPLIFLPIIPSQSRYLLLMVCAIIFSVSGALAGPAWLSLMSDHLPFKSRGKYFGWRNRLLGVIGLSCGLFAGQILQIFKKNVLWGFSLIFGLAFIFRLVSRYFLSQMVEPRQKNEANGIKNEGSDYPENFSKFVFNGKGNNFVRFSFFISSLTFAVNIVAPYLAVYMLRNLHYSYSTFTYVTFSSTLTAIFGVKIWGELADQFGNLRIIQATSIFISIIPIFWFVSGDPVWLVLVNGSAGFAWSGFQLCIMTYAFSELPASIRTRMIGYLSALNGMALFLGSYLGGILLNYLPMIRGSSFVGLFLISALARIFVVSYFLKRLRENRQTQSISTFGLYADALGLYPIFRSGKEILEIFFRKKK